MSLRSAPVDDGSPVTPPVHRRRGLSVRSRVLISMLVLAALGLLIAGASAFALQRTQVDKAIDAALTREVAEFAALHRDGLNPTTGKKYTLAADLVYAAMQRTAPSQNEGILGIVNGKVRWTAPDSTRLRLEDDPEFVELVIARSTGDAVYIERAVTALADYRFIVYPVSGSDGSAALVVGIDRGAQHAVFNQVFKSYAFVALGTVIVIAIAGWFIAGRLLRPIRILAQTAHQISDTDLSRRIPVTGRDDLASLVTTVNDMLDRLETSFTGQRKLLDDVGHELRTPLTIVRGHLELMDSSDPAEVDATRDLTLDEIARMQGLVNDLMMLATASHPDFVQTQPTDLGILTDDIHDKLRLLADRRWTVDSRAEVQTTLDPRRVTQALLQLGTNAVAHTEPGAVIAIGSELLPGLPGSHEHPTVRLWVRDEGTGVSPDELDVIFDRFVRGQGASPDSGAGLGLSIVAAIAHAHAGELLVESPPGQGATFSLVLPAVALLIDVDLDIDGEPDDLDVNDQRRA